MMCAWKELLAILPPRLRQETDALGKQELQELRLRINAPAELVLPGGSHWLSGKVTREELNYCVNAASRYSPWSAATAARGYITAPGGHRIGLCGVAVYKDGQVCGIRDVKSLCIRVARDFPGIAKSAEHIPGSILILGAPGWGKTTLLRDLIRLIAQSASVGVVDERGELFPEGFHQGKRMDVLTGCPKAEGMEMVLRTMAPEYLAVDEITAEADTRALIQAANCGVHLLAAAHAASVSDYRKRSVYRPLAEQGIFETLLVLRPDKSYRVERMTLCVTNGSVRC